MELNKKGLFFIIDAIIFLVLIISSVSLLQPETHSSNFQPKTIFLSKDIIGILEEITIEEVNATWANKMKSNKNISRTDVSVSYAIGKLWADGYSELASEILNYTFDGKLVGKSEWGLLVDGDSINPIDDSDAKHKSTVFRMVSGIDKGKPIEGFVTRAHAVKVRRNNTMIISVAPGGAGFGNGYFEVTKYFNLTNKTLINSTLTISVRVGDKKSELDFELNGCNYDGDDFTWLFDDSDGDVAIKQLSNSCYNTDGLNRLWMKFRDVSGDNVRVQPGTLLEIHYSDNITNLSHNNLFKSDRTYLENFKSREGGGTGVGIWTSIPFVIPKNAQNLSVFLQIAANGVRDYLPGKRCGVKPYNGNQVCGSFTGWDGLQKLPSSHDYMLFINNETPLDIDASPSSAPVYKYYMDDLDQNLINGTNIIAVYINTYGDEVWGTASGGGRLEFYSDPITDPEGSSFIEINYTLSPEGEIPYGAIEIYAVKEIGGVDNYAVTGNFTYPENIMKKGDTFIHLIEKESEKVTVWAKTTPFPPTEQMFISPASRAVPSTVFLDSDFFEEDSTVPNYVNATEYNSSYDILNISKIEYGFYVPAFVSYGGVFPNLSAADEDAAIRLEEIMGGYIKAEELVIDSTHLDAVPSLWGPAKIEVKAWD